MSDKDIDKANYMQDIVLAETQVMVDTQHSLHAGVYTRTVMIPKGIIIVGALVKRSTNLIISGHISVTLGDDEERVYKGYAILHAGPNRKQAFIAHEDTHLTMSFATDAETIEDAEDEFTDEAHLLMSRHVDGINHITITGE